MLTKDDKDEIKSIVVDVIQDVIMPAFEGINDKVERLNDKFEGLNDKFDGLNDKFEGLNDKFDGLKHDVNTKLDAVYKEVLDMRQEQTFHTQAHIDIHDRLDHIESVPVVAHHIKRK